MGVPRCRCAGTRITKGEDERPNDWPVTLLSVDFTLLLRQCTLVMLVFRVKVIHVEVIHVALDFREHQFVQSLTREPMRVSLTLADQYPLEGGEGGQEGTAASSRPKDS